MSLIATSKGLSVLGKLPMVVLSIPVTFRRRVSELKKGCEKGIEMMVVGVLLEEGPGVRVS